MTATDADFERRADALICAVLRDEKPSWPFATDTAILDRFFAHARRHSLAPLLGMSVAGFDWPQYLLDLYRVRVREQAAWELHHQALLAPVLEALAAEAIPSIVMKGTALAYSVYPDAMQRRRGDTDLMIAEVDTARVDKLLRDHGFKDVVASPFFHESSYAAGIHGLDVHRRISNRQFLSRLYSLEELRSRAVWLPRLSPQAVGPDLVDALIICCFHRDAHRTFNEDRLIWVYDAHLIAAAMHESDWNALAERSAEKEIAGAISNLLKTSENCFGTGVPSSLYEELQNSERRRGGRVSRYLAGGRLRQRWQDVASLEGAKRQFVMLFPPRSYLEWRLQRRIASWQVPWYQLTRLVGGAASRASGTADGPTRLPSKFQRLLQLPWAERRLLLSAYVRSPLVAAALKLSSLQSVLRIVERRRPRSTDLSLQDIRRIGELVNIGARRSIAPATCLTRSVLLVWILHRKGVAAQLKIGIDPRRSPYIAHAWVEYEGVAVNDSLDVADRYPAFDVPISLNSLHLE